MIYIDTFHYYVKYIFRIYILDNHSFFQNPVDIEFLLGKKILNKNHNNSGWNFNARTLYKSVSVNLPKNIKYAWIEGLKFARQSVPCCITYNSQARWWRVATRHTFYVNISIEYFEYYGIREVWPQLLGFLFFILPTIQLCDSQ